MSSPQRLVQEALHAAWTNDPGVKALLGASVRLYDAPPADVIYPYATHGRAETRRDDGDDAPITEHVLHVHVWSRYGGEAETKQILDALGAALPTSALDLGGARLVGARVAYTDVFRFTDGITTHGVLRLRAVTEPA